MNYKKIAINLLSVSIITCSGYSNAKPAVQSTLPSVTHNVLAWQPIERFQIQNSNFIIDTYSNLMWTRCVLGKSWNGYACDGITALYTRQEAQDVVKTINYGGYSDWRIPTLEELKFLADRENIAPIANIPYLNQFIFPTPECYGMDGNLDSDAHACWEWSSTPIEGSGHYASIVYFGYGYGSGDYETDAFALRLVRSNR